MSVGYRVLPKDRTELLAWVQEAREALDDTISAASREELTTREAGDGWSVKDHLEHLAAWRRKVLSLLHGRPGWEGLGVEEQVYLNEDDDAVNAIIWRRTRDVPLPQALAEFQETHRELLAELSGLSEKEWTRRFDPFRPGDLRPLIEGIAANSYWHDAEHREWIIALQARLRASSQGKR
jgi:uncharacterized damage-inducible protein DinB